VHGKTVQRLKEKFLFKVIVSEKEEVKEKSMIEKIQALIKQTLQRDLKELEQSLIMIKQQEVYMEQKSQSRNSTRTLINEIEELKKTNIELESERKALLKENEVLEKNYIELNVKLTEINEAMNLLEDTNKELLERSELCESNNENLASRVISLEIDIKPKDEALVKAQKVIEELYKFNKTPKLEKPQTINQYTETIDTLTSHKETNTEILNTLDTSVVTDRAILHE
jgi:chromosome segregation ATPase